MSEPVVDYAAAASELDSFAAKLRNVVGVSAELRRIGSLQQAGNEAQARLDGIGRRHAEAVADRQTALEGLLAKADAAKAEIERLTADGAQQHLAIESTLEAARTELAAAHSDLADATAQLVPLRQEKAEIERIKADAEANFAATSADLDRQIVQKRTELASAERSLADVQTKHAAVVEAHNSLKAKLL